MIGRAIARAAIHEHPTIAVDVDPHTADLLPEDVQFYSPQEACDTNLISQDDVLIWAAGVLGPDIAKDKTATEHAESKFTDLLAHLNNAPPRQLILISSLAVYGGMRGASETTPVRPITSYGIHKAHLEEIACAWAEQNDTELTIIRSCGVLGPVDEPGGGWMQAALSKFALGDSLDQSLIQMMQGQELLHSDDLARAILGVVEHGTVAPRILNVGSGVIFTNSSTRAPSPGLDWSQAKKELGYQPRYKTFREVVKGTMQNKGIISADSIRSSKQRRTMVLVGSHRTGSYSTALAHAVSEQLAAEGHEIDLIEVAELDLPIHNPVDHNDPESSADPRVRSFAQRVRDASSFVWITPIYHGSYSSGFKKAIDNINISLMQNKPVAVMAHGGGRFGGSVLDHLRAIGINLHAQVINVAVITNPTDFAETESKPKLVNEAIHARIERVVEQLLTIENGR